MGTRAIINFYEGGDYKPLATFYSRYESGMDDLGAKICKAFKDMQANGQTAIPAAVMHFVRNVSHPHLYIQKAGTRSVGEEYQYDISRANDSFIMLVHSVEQNGEFRDLQLLHFINLTDDKRRDVEIHPDGGESEPKTVETDVWDLPD